MVITEEMRKKAQEMLKKVEDTCSSVAMDNPELDADEEFNKEEVVADLLGDMIFSAAPDLGGRLAMIEALKRTANFTAWNNALAILTRRFRRLHDDKRSSGGRDSKTR